MTHHRSAEGRHQRLRTSVRRESTLFRTGVGAIVVHLLDDSFVQTEPGTSPRDHLASGLIPAAALLVIAWAHPRLRPGVRAASALVVGAFGLVAGGAAVGNRFPPTSMSGDDYTGLLAAVAGLLLVAMGVLRLWRTRRLDERPRRRYLRRALLGVATAAVAFSVVLPILFAYGYTHVDRSGVPSSRLGADHEEVSLRTSDGLRLEGWYVPSRNRAAVIVLAAGGRDEAQERARMLTHHGFGVLVFDLRGSGASEGDPFWWDAERDVKAALDFLRDQPDVDAERIGGLGLSLGGELMLQTAGDSTAIRAVVSEGAGIRSLREQLLKSGPTKWVSAPFWATNTMATAVFSNGMPPPNLRDLVARISPRPVFLIYSGHPVGGEELNAVFYAAAGQPKTLWKISDAEHTAGFDAHPVEYERRVSEFFDRALLANPRSR